MRRSHLVLDSERKQYHGFRERLAFGKDKYDNAYKEGIRNEKAAVAPDGDRPTTVLEAQVGKALHSSEIIKRLKVLNHNLFFEVSPVTKKIGLYYPVHGKKTYLGIAMEAGFTPEFSVRHADSEGKFLRETRGYRTVLQRLVRAGYITLAGCDRVFGLPTRDSANWQRLTT